MCDHIFAFVWGDKYNELLVNPVTTDTKTNTNYPICLLSAHIIRPTNYICLGFLQALLPVFLLLLWRNAK